MPHTFRSWGTATCALPLCMQCTLLQYTLGSLIGCTLPDGWDVAICGGKILDACPSSSSKLHEKHSFMFANCFTMLEYNAPRVLPPPLPAGGGMPPGIALGIPPLACHAVSGPPQPYHPPGVRSQSWRRPPPVCMAPMAGMENCVMGSTLNGAWAGRAGG